MVSLQSPAHISLLPLYAPRTDILSWRYKILGSCSIQQEGFHCGGSIDTQQRSYLTKSRKETVVEASNFNYASIDTATSHLLASSPLHDFERDRFNTVCHTKSA